MPLAAAIIMGSGLTMVGNSPLILLNDLLVAANGNLPSGVASIKPLTMFAPMPIGLALLAVGLLYFRLAGRRWLGSRAYPTVTPAPTERYFARTCGIAGEMLALTFHADSPWVVMAVGEAEAEKNAPFCLASTTGYAEVSR